MSQLRFLALGDSYTIGEGVSPADRWPEQLVRLLGESGFDVAQPEIIGTTGWTTDELAYGVEAASPSGSFDLVTLLIGVNNQYRGRPIKEYREQFRALLTGAVAFASEQPARVIVVSIPDWGVTPFATDRDRLLIAREIDAFNDVNRLETERVGARYVDITPISRVHPGEVTADGLHPSPEMHRRWAGLILRQALAALGDVNWRGLPASEPPAYRA